MNNIGKLWAELVEWKKKSDINIRAGATWLLLPRRLLIFCVNEHDYWLPPFHPFPISGRQSQPCALVWYRCIPVSLEC